MKNTEKNIKASREKVMKEMEAEVKAAAKVAAALKAELTAQKHKRDVIVEEVTQLTKELNALKEQLGICESMIEKYSKEVEDLSNKVIRNMYSPTFKYLHHLIKIIFPNLYSIRIKKQNLISPSPK